MTDNSVWWYFTKQRSAYILMSFEGKMVLDPVKIALSGLLTGPLGNESGVDPHLKGLKSSGEHHSDRGVEHYTTIGRTLAVCEAGSWRVGIPWLPPTRRIWALRSELEGSIEYYLRYNLVGIQTITLQGYCEDLLRAEEKDLVEKFAIPAPTRFERFAFLTLSATAATLITIIFTVTGGMDLLSGLTLAVVIGGIIAMLCATLSSDEHRRLSFSWILTREIMRRTGQDQSGSGGLCACPTPNT